MIGIGMWREIVKQMIESSGTWESPGKFPGLGHLPTQQKKYRPAIRQNHGVGTSKAERKRQEYSRKRNRPTGETNASKTRRKLQAKSNKNKNK